jgi:anti-sigma regulatory factor (Ser/Thr protein kinase)
VSQSPLLTEADIRLDGELTELSRLAADVARFCRDASLSGSAEFNLNLILEELFANAIAHGGCKGMPDAVAVHLARERDGSVSLEFSDRGTPFDPSGAPAPDLSVPLSQRTPGGLGLHFVRSLSRAVDYRRDDGWNRLQLQISPESL